jgi:hypothetical protein
MIEKQADVNTDQKDILGEKKSSAMKRPENKDEIRKDTTNTGPMGLDPNA